MAVTMIQMKRTTSNHKVRLCEAIINECQLPNDCNESVLQCLYKHLPNLLEFTRDNSMKSSREMISTVIWRVSLSASCALKQIREGSMEVMLWLKIPAAHNWQTRGPWRTVTLLSHKHAIHVTAVSSQNQRFTSVACATFVIFTICGGFTTLKKQKDYHYS